MSRDDSDIESTNPSKNFKVGDFDRLSGFFTPVWESKRRIRSESPIPSSSPGSTPRSSKASEPGTKVALSAKAAAAKAIADKAAAANAAAAKAAAAREAAIKAAAARAAASRSPLTRTGDVKAAVVAPPAAVTNTGSGTARGEVSRGGAQVGQPAAAAAVAPVRAQATPPAALGHEPSAAPRQAGIETHWQSPLVATLIPGGSANPKALAAQKAEALRPSDGAAATRGSTPERALAAKGSRAPAAPAKSNPALAAPTALAKPAAPTPPVTPVMDPYRTTPPPMAVGARPVIPMPPPTPRLSGRGPSDNPSAAVTALKQAGPNLPPEAFLDVEPDFRAPPVAAPAAPRVEKPGLHYRSLRASVAATAVHEQLRAKLQASPLSLPESQGVLETYSEAMPVAATPARSGAPNEYLSQHLLRRLRRTIRLSAALPDAVRALIAKHDRH